MKSIILSLALLCSCTAYQHHPVATVASVATLGVAAGGIAVGTGELGGQYGDTWQNNAAHYGVAQISVLAAIGATWLLVWAYEDGVAQ